MRLEMEMTGSVVAQSGEKAEEWLRAMGIEAPAAGPVFLRERGRYVVGWGQSSTGIALQGIFVDLTQASLPVLQNPTVGVAGPFILYRLGEDLAPGSVVATSVPRPAVTVSADAVRLRFDRPAGEPVVGRVVCPTPPERVQVTGTVSPIEERWDALSATYYWAFVSNGEPTIIDLVFASRR
jgi:hypothetical protein